MASRPLTLGFALTALSTAPVFAQTPDSLSPGLQLQEQLRTPPLAPTLVPEAPRKKKPLGDPCPEFGPAPSGPTQREPVEGQGPGQPEPAQQDPVWPRAPWQPQERSTPDGAPPTSWSQERILLGQVSLRGTNNYGVQADGRPFSEADLPKLFHELRDRFQALGKTEPLSLSQLAMAQQEAHSALNLKGYVLSQVLLVVGGVPKKPDQIKEGDRVDVVIVASFIEKLRLCEGGDALQAYVRKMLQPLVGGPKPKLVFNVHDLERQLWLMRSFGAVEFTPLLLRGQQFGGTELVGRIKPISPKVSVLTDNNVPQQLGSWRLGASLDGYVHSVQPLHVSAIGDNAFPVPGGFVDGFLQVSTPLGNQGWTGEFLWGITSTSSVNLLAGSNTLQTGGLSNYWSLGASYPLVMRRNSGLSVGVKGTLQNSTNDLYENGQQSQDLSTDRIRAIRFTLDGYLQSPPAEGENGRISLGRVSQLGFVLSQGFAGLGSDLAAGELLSNPKAAPNFTSARLNLAHYQDLTRYNRLSNNLTTVTLATLKGAAQLSSTALPVPEQFTYGGPYYGRAFNSAYLLGDEGWSVSLELGQRFLFNPNGLTSLRGKTYVFEPFVWYDYGFTSNRTSVQEGGFPSQSAASLGIGVRGSILGGTSNIELGWGIPSTNTLQSSQTGADNSIVYFKAKVRF